MEKKIKIGGVFQVYTTKVKSSVSFTDVEETYTMPIGTPEPTPIGTPTLTFNSSTADSISVNITNIGDLDVLTGNVEYEVDYVDTFDSEEYGIFSTISSPFSISNLTIDYETWYIRARNALNTGEDGTWSSTLSANIQPLTVPTITFVSSSETSIAIDITNSGDLELTTGEIEFEIDHVDTFDSADTRFGTTTSSSISSMGLPLEYNTWYVRAMNVLYSGRTSAWSSTVTAALQTPPLPIPILSFSSSTEDSITISVSNIDDLDVATGGIEYEIDRVESFSSVDKIFNTTTSNLFTESSIPTSHLDWFVRARQILDGGDIGDWSTPISANLVPEAVDPRPLLAYNSSFADTVTIDVTNIGDLDTVSNDIVFEADYVDTFDSAELITGTATTSPFDISGLTVMHDMWYIRAKIGTSSYGRLRYFSNLPVPSLSYAFSGQDFIAVKIDNINDVSFPLCEIELELDSSTTFNTVDKSSGTVVESPYYISGIHLPTYEPGYVRARTIHGSNHSAWSTFLTVNDSPTPLTVPTLSLISSSNTSVRVDITNIGSLDTSTGYVECEFGYSAGFSTLAAAGQIRTGEVAVTGVIDLARDKYFRARQILDSGDQGAWSTTLVIPAESIPTIDLFLEREVINSVVYPAVFPFEHGVDLAYDEVYFIAEQNSPPAYEEVGLPEFYITASGNLTKQIEVPTTPSTSITGNNLTCDVWHTQPPTVSTWYTIWGGEVEWSDPRDSIIGSKEDDLSAIDLAQVGALADIYVEYAIFNGLFDEYFTPDYDIVGTTLTFTSPIVLDMYTRVEIFYTGNRQPHRTVPANYNMDVIYMESDGSTSLPVTGFTLTQDSIVYVTGLMVLSINPANQTLEVLSPPLAGTKFYGYVFDPTATNPIPN